jgi:membrane protein implicated in regulation of membrane protease activity
MPKLVNWLLVFAGAVLILIEVLLGAATGFDFLLLGSAVLLGGVLGLLLHSPAVGLATAGVLSLLYVGVGRRRLRGRLHRPGIPSNTDALLGRTVSVTETVGTDRAGRIKIEGEEWRAQLDGVPGERLEAGAKAKVTRIDGVTVYVVATGEGVPEGGRP